MSDKFDEYPPMRETRAMMNSIRTGLNLSCEQVAKMIAEETGYHFTGPKYFAIEKGITKDVPWWVVAAFMKVLDLPNADTLFPYVGRMY